MPNQSNPISPNGIVPLNWNGKITEASIQATSGSYQSLGKISFPIMEITTTFSQDIVQHKRPNVPGARIESLGANPITFKIKAPFLSGLQRGSGETWGNLYPTAFSNVLQILNDQVAPVITFVHSTMGTYTVKPSGGSTITTADIRNGQILEFELITANEDNSNQSTITTSSEIGLAQVSATLFDQQLPIFIDSLPVDAAIPDYLVTFIATTSLSDLLQSVLNAFNQTTLFINSASNVVSNAIYQINALSTALATLDSPGVALLQMQLERCQSGVYSQINNQALPQTPSAASQMASNELQQALQSQRQLNILNGTSNLGVFVVNAQMTLGNVCLLVHNTADQIIALNPALAKSPTIDVGTQVVFYGTAAVQPTNTLASSSVG